MDKLNIKNEIWEHTLATSAAVVSRLSMLLITLINMQFLSPQQFGLFAILSLVANIVVAFVSCGGDMWLNRFCRARHMQFERAPIVTRFYLQISVVLAAFVLFSALGFATIGRSTFENQGLTIAFCLIWAATSGLVETILAILRTTNEIHRFFVVRDFFMPITLMLAIYILKIDTALEFFLTAFILWLGTLLFLLNYILSRSALYMPRSYWSWQLLKKELTGYTVNLIMNNFTARLANGFDTLLLSRILPIDIVGRYRLMAHFSNAFSVVQHFVFLALPWHLRQAKTTDPHVKLGGTIQFRQQLLLLSALPALMIFIFAAKPFLTWLDVAYKDMSVVLCILLLIRFGELIWGPQHEKLISNNEVFEDTKANLLSLAIGLTVFFLCLSYIGPIRSAVMSIAVSSFVGRSRRFFIIKKKLKNNTNEKFPILPLMISISAIYFVYFIA